MNPDRDDAEYLRHDVYVATVITGGDGKMRLFDIADRYEKMQAALEWYAERAESLAKNEWHKNPEYAVAIFTELSLDGGRRAREALRQTEPNESEGGE